MADPNSPDYYKQVAQEAKEAYENQSQTIDKKVDEVLAAHMKSVIRALEIEFGRAAVGSADLLHLENVLYSLAHSASDKARSVMIDDHYKESQASLGNTLNAVLTGIQIGEGRA